MFDARPQFKERDPYFLAVITVRKYIKEEQVKINNKICLVKILILVLISEKGGMATPDCIF